NPEQSNPFGDSPPILYFAPLYFCASFTTSWALPLPFCLSFEPFFFLPSSLLRASTSPLEATTTSETPETANIVISLRRLTRRPVMSNANESTLATLLLRGQLGRGALDARRGGNERREDEDSREEGSRGKQYRWGKDLTIAM